MSEAASPVELAEHVAATARGLNIETALIGASALAVHGYVRGTSDIDLASMVDPYTELPRLQQALEADGFKTKLNFPDADDDLGGLLRVWKAAADDGDPIEPVDVVNLLNPHRPLRLPARAMITDAVRIDEHSSLRCVTLPHLILLKLYAGARRDLADVVAVLEENPDVDTEALRLLCKQYGHTEIDILIAEANAPRERR
ncbi:MAG: nucleotidyl transferase AbiEii/AbiGii toxin family protein [Myxococcota bacterium]|nr:nucleotidyl transferase AbiEii/AbiGii toxin family protein [Myxococcota bacterium]